MIISPKLKKNLLKHLKEFSVCVAECKTNTNNFQFGHAQANNGSYPYYVAQQLLEIIF